MASYRQAKGKITSGGNWDFSFSLDPYARYQLSRTPILGDFMRASDQEKYYRDYFRNTGLKWSDVKYPALLGGQNYTGAFVGAGYTAVGGMVSRNLLKLYR